MKKKEEVQGTNKEKSREVATNFLLISQQINIIKEELCKGKITQPKMKPNNTCINDPPQP